MVLSEDLERGEAIVHHGELKSRIGYLYPIA